MKNPVPRCLLIALLACSAPGSAAGDETLLPAPLPEQIVVSASQIVQRVMDTAASISVIGSRELHDAQAEQNLSESLLRTPGIFALNRQNYAQDLLISSRGFGANSTFGARGIKIFVDGIPGTAADGQGQISHVDLASADHVEVLRGPFSVLYGNSAGGVISVFTENGKPGVAATPYFSGGSYGQRKYGLKAAGEQGQINYLADAGSLHSDGYRDHSSVDRTNENAKLTFKLGQDTTLYVVANGVALRALDPLGLTAAQWQSSPSAAGSGAASFNTRKSVDQTQGGTVFQQRLGPGDTATLSLYDGDRQTTQYLASAVNGVVNLQRNFHGLAGKWLHQGEVAGMALKLVGGVDSNQNQDHRLTFSNAAGQALVAASDQDYAMSARNLDGYFQGELRPDERLALTLGARQSATSLSAISNNALASLGEHNYRAMTGMASAQYYVRDDSNLYLSYGSGFDTPTLNQILYSPSYVNFAGTNSGNMALQAARTRQVEIGFKSEIPGKAQLRGAVFQADTRNDVVIAASNGGKTAYLNAPRTSRQGVELSAQWQLPYQLQASLAYTYLQATVEQAYTVNITNTSNVTTANTVNAGNRIPGVPGQGIFAELLWRRPDKSLEFALEGRASGSMAANDLNRAYAAGYGIVNFRALVRQELGQWSVSEFARIDNLFDRSYVGSVIVNQAASQFYEGAPGRNWLVGVKGTYRF